MFKYITILTCYLFLYSCYGQYNNKNSNKDSNKDKDTTISDTTAIIDTFIEMPYIIERNNMFVDLPDSLGGKRVNGNAVLELIIDNNSKIIKININKLFINEINSHRVIIDFPSNQNTSDINIIKKYNPFFINYVHGLRIDKIGSPQKVNSISFMVKFN